ncbi:MAG: ABC transporter ATP-binding protein [Actinomycetota bacterium]|nr:ABC transporter ATP-binding protein [Actinomycetota bacterium]MDA3016029.1 ABC transporter ATP-binding protein [Actinomycetota bacterium]
MNVADRSAAIVVDGLRKSYAGRDVVRGVSFRIEAGECFGLLGHNGAGKTTTIEILEGYLDRDAGTVSVLGCDPADATAEWRRRIGVVLQDMDVFPTLTVVETVRMFADLYPDPRGVAETIDMVGLTPRSSARVGGLSGGEKRRLDVALGIIGDPELLFLDEPTTGLDPAARREVWAMVDELKGTGVTIVLTTHYMDEAQILADRLVILDDGVVAADGTFDELLRVHGDARTISFRLPVDVPAESMGAAIGVEFHADGFRVEFSSVDPQRDLFRLLGWAEERRVLLDDLAVRRSSLDDLFLSVSAEDAATGAAGTEALR